MFKKVLVANRGEIACRVIRTLREMSVPSVAVFSSADRAALHVRLADEAVGIGEAPAAASYLCIDRVLEAARKSGAEAIHPGYGFLSENAAFAQACVDAGLTFIGPRPASISAMGSKTAARNLMSRAGVPVVPGAECATLQEARTQALRLGLPVMLKAAAGGGGKGMRLLQRIEELDAAWERARSEARKAFGDDTVYLEKAIVAPRHVEIQVLGDQHGKVVHLFERDCSIQRRHQKVVEETPCPAADAGLIARMAELAVKGARAVDYCSAGTFEFLLSPEGQFYFLEMNTRLQVEHPITEWITGLDLVREMIRLAAGEPLGWTQRDIDRRGAAIECRVYAEDPARNFMPSPGTIQVLRTPSGPGVRDDSGVYAGAAVPSYYDPLISKLSVWAPTREQALHRMRRALSEYVVTGIRTNLSFHDKLMRHPQFVAGCYDTGFIERNRQELLGDGYLADGDREAQCVAVALAAARLELQDARAAQRDEPGQPGPSPWVAGHRARTLRS